MRSRARAGTTLLELVVVLSLLTLMLALVPAAVWHVPAPRRDTGAVDRARVTAILEARPLVARDSQARTILFLPDGRAVGAGRDPLTGAGHDAPQ